MASLQQQLEDLANPTPLLPDLEDDDEDGTSARKIFQKHDEVDEVEAGTRRFRQAINLEENDKKYQGKKISKAEIFGDNSGFSLTNGHNGEFESDDADEGEDEDDDEAEDDEEEDDYDLNGSHLVENGDDDEEEESDEEHWEAGDDDEMNGIKTMEDVDTSTAQKGEAVQAQLAIWDRIMHLTIKTHAALRSFNQLPRGDAAKELNKNLSEETKANLKKVRQNIFESTSVLLDIEKIVLRQNKNQKEEDDEEVESSEDEKEDEDDEEEEEGDVDENMEEETEHSNKAKRDHSISRIHHLQKLITSRDSEYSKIRSTVLTKWDDRTKLVGRKTKKNDLSALESSIMKQIDRVLSDKYRLLRRTQTKRSDNERLCGVPESAQDPEIFDDDDFYQALLKDFIDQKSSQTNDPVAMSRQFLELQKLRQKRTKKIVDTKATKGRKIRYVTVPKMVNFFPACPETIEWPHEKRNELFKSLFK